MNALLMFPNVGNHWVGGIHMLFFGVLLPILVFRAHRKIAGGTRPIPDRAKHFPRATLEGMTFMSVSIAVASATRIDLFSIDTSRLGRGLLAGAAMYAAAVLYMRPRWRRAVERRAPIVSLYMPRNASERAWWILVSLIAGIGEEITWRGVQTQLLVPLVGSYLVAVILCAISFGLVHFIQGWRSVIVVVVFALGFQAVVWASGSLYVAMLAHVAYDITAGLSYGRLGRKLGYALPDATRAGESPSRAPLA
jgi:membrane protease YdiL (CAAX protease family)